MRRRRNGWIATIAALAAGLAIPPAAQAITNVYALQASLTAPGGTLVQYAVGPDGALAAEPPDTPLDATPQDIAVTPNARFAYVMTSSPTASIVPFVRGANGRLERNGPETGALGAVSRGIVVNPQGTRVYYGHPGNFIAWREINADGTLGPPHQFAIGTGPVQTPWAQTLAMTPDGRNLYGAQFAAAGEPTVVWQSSIDPATGDGAPKSPAYVEFPATAGAPAPSAEGRMAISPAGTHLYLAPDTSGSGIARWAIDPANGALVGGTIAAPAGDGNAEAVVALSTRGTALWAPSGGAATAAGADRIRQFSIGAGGALAPLATTAVSGPARDAVASPDGASLYLGQNGVVSEWEVAPGGALSPRNAGPIPPPGGFVNAGIAVAPSQAPVASFSVSTMGRTAVFDARASVDPDGTIARYDWDFGDGSGATNAGPVVRHAYSTRGRHTVALTVTDADGTSTEKLWTGTRMLRNGGPSARVTGTVTISVTVRPRQGRSVTVAVVSGRIFVRLPGSAKWIALNQLREIPLGSVVDARKGKTRVTAEVNAKTRRTQKSVFYDWYFKVRQTKGSRPVTEARMVNGSFAACRPSRRGRSGVVRRARKKSSKTVRRLWGRGKGNFRTRGKHSSATVRGTTWLVEDRCDGTLTRVKRGRVEVRVRGKKQVVRLSSRKGARSSYLAKAP